VSPLIRVAHFDERGQGIRLIADASPTGENEAMGVVHESVEDCVGYW
jgi:hypothetical protein